MRVSTLRRGALIGCLGLSLGCWVAPASAKPLPNLRLSNVANPPASAHPGDTFQLAITEKNAGERKAGASMTRFYLSLDTKKGSSDVRFPGGQAIPKLKPGAKVKKKAPLEVPGSVAQDDYFVLGCADDKRAVRESNERDNCHSSKAKVAVTVLPIDTTPYEINQGTVPAGSLVSLSNMTVTAVGPGNHFWVAVQTGDAAYNGLSFSGLEVVDGSASPLPLQVGAKADLVGTSHNPGPSTPGLTASSVTQTGVGVVDAPHVLSAPEIANHSAEINALLVRAENVTVSSHVSGGWLMVEGFTVGNGIIGTLPTVANGAPLAFVAGIADTTGSSLVLSPREANDIDVPPLLASFTNLPVGHSCMYGVGQVNTPIAQVTLSIPADGDTFVVVDSGNTSAITISGGGVTVPNGQTSAQVLGNKLGAGTSTLTATLGTTQLTTQLTIRGPADPVDLLELSLPDSVNVGSDALGSVTLDCEAPADTLVTLASNSAHATVPANVTVQTGQTSATFLAHGVSSGPATISATLGATTLQSNLNVN